ncbi:MAG: nitrite reductase (NAD(P)H) small subunit [Nitrosomonadales bacterium]|nr:MAG: nitrite reductase (NAD(P)H) small subunit [Nitrosomonadales bacterium]
MSNWIRVAPLNEFPQLGARVVRHDGKEIAVFRNAGEDVFAMNDSCPHKGGPLSQGIVYGNTVTCPLHGMNICFDDGKALAPDEGCVGTYPVKVEEGVVFLQV